MSQSNLRFGKDLKDLHLSDIQFLINEKIDESQNLDYTQPSSDPEKDCDGVAKEVSGFLNTDGGIVIYGVSERREEEHCYPDRIIWSTSTKEWFENMLDSRIQPWDERIRIRRIENEQNPTEGIFVIEVPKSNNPPHMFNHVYYQRLNFKARPMEHENVYRAFQTSWLRRRDISKNVIEPLYSEIKYNSERIRDFRDTSIGNYEFVILDSRFLFDQIDSLTRIKINEFYDRLEKYNNILCETRRLTSRMIADELCRVKPDLRELIQQHINETLFQINLVLKDANGNVQTRKEFYVDDILLKKSLSENIYNLSSLFRR
jgi:hypothetical protein